MNHSSTAGHVPVFIADMALDGILRRQAKRVDVGKLLACISLAGTLRKVLFRSSHSYANGVLTPSYAPRISDLLAEGFSTDLGWAHPVGYSYPAAGFLAGDGDSSQARHNGSSDCNERDSSHVDPIIATRPEMLLQRQLSCILTATYVQERNKDVRAMDVVGLVCPLEARISSSLQGMAERCLGLSDSMPTNNMLLQSHGVVRGAEREAEHDRIVATIWDRHAQQHFHGRLLPGCCNLHCKQLEGVSEAALPTLLCSGCRRARYCCQECQKEAWLKCGHSLVCGEPLE